MRDAELDALFHAHLQQVYVALGEAAPAHVAPHAGAPTVVWTPTAPVPALPPGARLLVRTNHPGRLLFAVNGIRPPLTELVLVRGSDAGVPHWQRLLGPFAPGDREVTFRVVPSDEPPGAPPAAGAPPQHRVVIVEPAGAAAGVRAADARLPASAAEERQHA